MPQTRPVRVRGAAPGDDDLATLWQSGIYDYYTRFRTGLATTFTGPAPLTVRTSAPDAVRRGARARIGVRVLAGAEVRPLAGMRVELQQHDGSSWMPLTTHVTDSAGHTVFEPQLHRPAQFRALVLEQRGYAATSRTTGLVGVTD